MGTAFPKLCPCAKSSGKYDLHTQEGGVDPAVQGAQLEDRFHNNQSFKKPDVDASDPQQQDAALRIQTKYRQFHAKRVVQEKREEQAAIKIQAGVRGMHDRQRVKDMKEGNETEESTAPQEEVPAAQKTEEEVDIDLDDPATQDAAVKIQAGFKGYKARKEVKEMKTAEGGDVEQTEPIPDKQEEGTEEKQDGPEVEKAATTIQAGFKGMKARREVKAMKEAREKDKPEAEQPAETKEEQGEQPAEAKEEEDAAPAADDPNADKAAVKIQAGFRGMKARREVKEMKAGKATEEQPPEQPAEGATEATKPEEEEVDIDLEDPEVQKAAAKIQASFRGFQTRKDIKDQKSETEPTEGATAEEEKKQE